VLSPGFTSEIFTLYGSWENVSPNGHNEGRAAVARDEILFNTMSITISGVNGLNLFAGDPLAANMIVGTCGACHDSPNVGNHSKKLPINIGIADGRPPVLYVSGLPVFTVKCIDTTGPLKGQTFIVTDLGKALVRGSCGDVGKVKGPNPTRIGGAGAVLQHRLRGYIRGRREFLRPRFGVGFTDQEKTDLVAFLKTL